MTMKKRATVITIALICALVVAAAIWIGVFFGLSTQPEQTRISTKASTA